MNTLLRAMTIWCTGATLATASWAALPRTIDEAEAFANTLINDTFYHELGFLSRPNLQKMRFERNPAGTATTYYVPRTFSADKDVIVTVTLAPRNGGLGLGHHRTHEPLQQHKYTYDPNEKPYPTQREEYGRIVYSLGPESACLHVRATRIATANIAEIQELEFNWLPNSQDKFGVQVVVRNLRENVRADANIGSDAFHTIVDKFAATLIVGVARAAAQQDFLAEPQLRATENYYRAVGAMAHVPYNAEVLTASPASPRLMTVAAAQANSPVAAASTSATILPTSPAIVISPPPPRANLIRLEPEQVLQHAIALRLINEVPSPTPTVTAVRPPAPPSAPVAAVPMPGVRGVRIAPPTAPRSAEFDNALLMGLLFAPDVRLLVTKEVAGASLTVFAHAKGDWAAVVVETTEGLHLPVVSPKHDFPTPFARFLRLDSVVEPGPTLNWDIPPLRLFVLRALFELDATTRLTTDADTAALTGYGLDEIVARLDSPDCQLRLDALPTSAQWTVQGGMGNPLLLGIELTLLRQQKLVSRHMINGAPRYQLTPAGRANTELLFAPDARLRVTRAPSSLTKPQPTLHLINAAHFAAGHSARITFFPDGSLRFSRTPWRGDSSLWHLFAHLTEPET